jgi:hypothetical protein
MILLIAIIRHKRPGKNNKAEINESDLINKRSERPSSKKAIP